MSQPALHPIAFTDDFRVTDPAALAALRQRLIDTYSVHAIISAADREHGTGQLLTFLMLDHGTLVITTLQGGHSFIRSYRVTETEVERQMMVDGQVLCKVWSRYFDQAAQYIWLNTRNDHPTAYTYINQQLTPTSGNRLQIEIQNLAEEAAAHSTNRQYADALYLAAAAAQWDPVLTRDQTGALQLILPSFKPLYNELLNPTEETQDKVCAFLQQMDDLVDVTEGEEGLCALFTAKLDFITTPPTLSA